MTLLRLAALFLSASLLAPAAQAQDQRNWCFETARQMCGDYQISLADCMGDYDLWPLVPNECVGEIQTMIEIEREAGYRAPVQDNYTPAPPVQDYHSTSNALGYSYGGILRDGPGMQYRKLASLHENDWLEVLEDTGVWFDGYKWFRVQTPMGVGYHWGGIFCVDQGQSIDGVFSYCN